MIKKEYLDSRDLFNISDSVKELKKARVKMGISVSKTFYFGSTGHRTEPSISVACEVPARGIFLEWESDRVLLGVMHGFSLEG